MRIDSVSSSTCISSSAVSGRTTQTRLERLPGRGNLRKGSCLRVEFGGKLSWCGRACWKIEHHGRLRQVAPRGPDSRRLAGRGIAAIRGDGKGWLLTTVPVVEHGGDMVRLQAAIRSRALRAGWISFCRATASSRTALRWALGMLRPKNSSPISLARKVTVGARTSRDVASRMRMVLQRGGFRGKGVGQPEPVQEHQRTRP